MAPISHNQNKFLTYFEGVEHKKNLIFLWNELFFHGRAFFLVLCVQGLSAAEVLSQVVVEGSDSIFSTLD